MLDEQILAALRSKAGEASAVEVAGLLDRMLSGGLTAFALVAFFKHAFPAVPLQTMIEATAWRGVGGGGMSDEEFNALLQPWVRRG